MDTKHLLIFIIDYIPKKIELPIDSFLGKLFPYFLDFI